jgi:polyisoprenoid-binding protein YceI
MRKHLLLSALALATLAPTAFAGNRWEIDASHSRASFSVRHMMVTNTRGEFTKVSGVAILDDKDMSKSMVEATIDATSVNTNNADRDKHLKAPDFFDTANHASITFKSKKVSKAGKGKYKVLGDLTIKGVTKEVTLDVEELTEPVKDPWGNTRRGAAASTKINRQDYNLKWNTVLEKGGVAVGDEVKIALDVELIMKDAAPAAAPQDAKAEPAKEMKAAEPAKGMAPAK